MEQEIALLDLDKEKIELLKKTICVGSTNEELQLFIYACNRSQLDPFMKQIYAVKRKSKDKNGNWIETMTIQTSIDGYRLIAERTGRYIPGRDYTFNYQENKLISATAYVKKLANDGSWHEISHSVFWAEYAPTNKEGQLIGMWKNMPHVMLGKCAEAACLRRAFPADLSGLYTKEEMEQSEVAVIDEREAPKASAPEKEAPKVPEECISASDAEMLIYMTKDDKEYLKKLLTFLKIDNFYKLPKNKLESTLKSIERNKNEAVSRGSSGNVQVAG